MSKYTEAIADVMDIICESNTTKPTIAAFEQEKQSLWTAIEALQIAECIKSMPTIDIVHCRECKHNTGGECRKIPMGFDIACYDQWVEPEDDFFCKYGERKDNNGYQK